MNHELNSHVHHNEAYHTPEELEEAELEKALSEIWDIAEEFGLDPFPTNFEIIPPNIMTELGSYGIPNRFSHWTFGREYRKMKTMYDWGLSKIYELVINSNPSQAFLLENNPPIENKFVMAHVLGHTDFFKNNHMFTPTRKDMPEAAARHADTLRAFEDRYGQLEVEEMLDDVLSIEEHIDPYLAVRPQRQEELLMWRQEADRQRSSEVVYEDEFDDILGHRRGKSKKISRAESRIAVPPSPDRDLLGFIRNHAPYLDDWQREVIDIVRSESIYFYPQRRTKIMNEGWAAYWHKRIMREMGDRDLISDEDNEAWWLVHSSVVAPNPRSLNPYYLGMMIYEYLEDFYNGNLSESEQAWLKKEGVTLPPKYEGPLKDSPALAELREVMSNNDDQSFIRNYFDKNVAERMNMYLYEQVTYLDGSTDNVVVSTGWKDIRDSLVSSMDNNGSPLITVINGDYNRAKELYLRHEYDGQTLDPEYIEKTLPHLYNMWQRPVYLETVDSDGEELDDDLPIVYMYDGEKFHIEAAGS